MNNSLFSGIQDSARYLNLDLSAQEIAQFSMDHNLNDE